MGRCSSSWRTRRDCHVLGQGTDGQEDPFVTATCSVIGADAYGVVAQTWVAASPYTLDAGATAADLSEALFAQAGLSADYDPDGAYGWELKTITSPFDAGQTLGWDEATGRYWQLFVNGQPASTGASGVVLQAGDSVIWCYSAYGDPAPTDRLSVTCEVVGTDASGAWETWATPTTMALEAGSTAADLSEALFAQVGLVADTGVGDYGWFLNSIASPYDARAGIGAGGASVHVRVLAAVRQRRDGERRCRRLHAAGGRQGNLVLRVGRHAAAARWLQRHRSSAWMRTATRRRGLPRPPIGW